MEREPSYVFGELRFNAESGELETPDGLVRLAPQPATVLSALLENAGKLVTRDELSALLWPKGYVEADLGINHCLRQVRRALGDDAQDPQFIETLPRRGYRFIAPVSQEGVQLDPAALPTPTATRPPPRSFTAGWLGPFVLIVILSAILAGVAVITQSRAAPTVVVLPFVPAAPRSAATAAGVELQALITEALVDETSVDEALAELRIRGPASNDLGGPASPMDGSDIALATELGAQYVVSGTLDEDADRSQVFAQLVRVSDGAHLWADRSETSSDSLSVVANAVTQHVLRFLRRR